MIEKKCKKCGKYFFIYAHRLKINRGIFCSRKCYYLAIKNISLSEEHRKNISHSLKGHIFSEETKEKIRQKSLGKKLSEETRKKISIANTGHIPSMEHRKKLSDAGMGHLVSQETRKKISDSNKGKKRSEETKQKMSAINKGKKLSEETKIKMSNSRKGEKSRHLWKGGITPINKKIRASREYRLWREAVFKRDNWTCQWCRKRGTRLQADHIKPFSLFPELRFAIDNGRTLCIDCHKKTDTWGRKNI